LWRWPVYSPKIWRLYRYQNLASILAMKKSPFHPGPMDDLSNEALAALRRIKEGQSITARQCLELEIDELIQQGLGGWMLTDVGHYRLERGH